MQGNTNIDTEALLLSDLSEHVNNNSYIDWRHWTQFHIWDVEQAARLMLGLDPKKFSNLKSRPNKNDQTIPASNAQDIEDRAKSQDITKLSPDQWVKWFDGQEWGFILHYRLRIEVEAAQIAAVGADSLRTNKVVKHSIQNRNSILSAEIALATSNAIDPEDHHCIWAELVKLANNKHGCLIDVAQGEIKYLDGDDTKFLSKKSLRERVKRKKKAC